MMRKLATIREIRGIVPIKGADAIECAIVDGWNVVIRKGEYQIGDRVVYAEIDSWIPHELAPFLSKGKEPREFQDIKGERLRTIKLRGQLSQGLLLPLDTITDKIYGKSPLISNIKKSHLVQVGDDVTEFLGIVKWEPIINASMAAIMKGEFPSHMPKTDQERVQNLPDEIASCVIQKMQFEITEKLEGASMTVYKIDGEFGVCSRNIDLLRDGNNAMWKIAIDSNIEEKLEASQIDNIAIQGEIIGPGIQGNIYNLLIPHFMVFDVYSITHGFYLKPLDRRELIRELQLTHVPVLFAYQDLGTGSINDLLLLAEGKSELNPKIEREGIVFKEVRGGMSFKVVSNKYLTKQG